MDTSDLVKRLIDKEWSLFQETQNRGGRASCQDDPDTFAVMRSSQFRCWNEATLRSYDEDLDVSTAEGRNMVMEKYAYMMRRTHPEEFEQIKDFLPPISKEKGRMIEEIVSINMDWEAACDRLLPHVRAAGRTLYSTGDSCMNTSFETYLRGELSTYSERTLSLLLEHTRQCRKTGDNLARRNLEYMAASYGYPSLEELELRKARLAAARG